MICFDLLLNAIFLEINLLFRVLFFNPLYLDLSLHLNAFGLKILQHQFCQITVFFGKYFWVPGHDGDLRTKPPESMAEFAAYGSSADDEKLFRKFP
jgi:hypothetical protein